MIDFVLSIVSFVGGGAAIWALIWLLARGDEPITEAERAEIRREMQIW